MKFELFEDEFIFPFRPSKEILRRKKGKKKRKKSLYLFMSSFLSLSRDLRPRANSKIDAGRKEGEYIFFS